MGCANIAKRSLIPALIENDHFEFIAIASRTSEKAAEFASLFNTKGVVGYGKLLEEDIDAVYVPLPSGLHQEWVQKCLEAGKHVLVEKSFCINHKSALALLDMAVKNDLVIMENFMFPFHNQHKKVLELLEGGVIGEIRNFRATFCFPPLAQGNFRYDASVGGGAVLDAAAYTVKASQVFLGKELKYLSSSLHFDKEKNVDIIGSAHFVYKQRIPVQLSWGFDNYYQCGVEILGSKGKLTTHRSYTAPPGVSPTAFLETQNEKKEILLPADDHFQKMLHEFSRRINENLVAYSAEEVKTQSCFLNEIQTKSEKGIYEAQ